MDLFFCFLQLLSHLSPFLHTSSAMRRSVPNKGMNLLLASAATALVVSSVANAGAVRGTDSTDMNTIASSSELGTIRCDVCKPVVGFLEKNVVEDGCQPGSAAL